jgi:hypothetical protein
MHLGKALESFFTTEHTEHTEKDKGIKIILILCALRALRGEKDFDSCPKILGMETL